MAKGADIHLKSEDGRQALNWAGAYYFRCLLAQQGRCILFELLTCSTVQVHIVIGAYLLNKQVQIILGP